MVQLSQETLARQDNAPVDSQRQNPMTASQHNRDEDELAQRMEIPTKRSGFAWDAERQSYVSDPGQRDPPEIVGQLVSDMQPAKTSLFRILPLLLVLGCVVCFELLRIEPYASLFVDMTFIAGARLEMVKTIHDSRPERPGVDGSKGSSGVGAPVTMRISQLLWKGIIDATSGVSPQLISGLRVAQHFCYRLVDGSVRHQNYHQQNNPEGSRRTLPRSVGEIVLSSRAWVGKIDNGVLQADAQHSLSRKTELKLIRRWDVAWIPRSSWYVRLARRELFIDVRHQFLCMSASGNLVPDSLAEKIAPDKDNARATGTQVSKYHQDEENTLLVTGWHIEIHGIETSCCHGAGSSQRYSTRGRRPK
ncbi:hypothetical protein KC345_g197 [Hortaea werneckii]|nr:hypothetical protein KC345_g197 [Hortaea werneckii]